MTQFDSCLMVVVFILIVKSVVLDGNAHLLIVRYFALFELFA